MPSIEIPDGPTSVVLKPVTVNNQTTNTGSATFSVTNKVGSPVGTRLSVLAEGNAKGEWFDIQGEKERTFAPSETQKITVNIKVPGNIPPGDYKLRCRAVNEVDPDNDYTNSAVVTVTVPPKPVPKPSGGVPWWVWLIVGGVVLLIAIGVIVYFVFFNGPSQVAVPNVKSGLSYSDAAKQITDAGLVAQKDPNPATSGTPNTVVGENPDAGAMVDQGSTVVLSVAQAGTTPPPQVEVPDVSTKGYNFDTAQGVLIAAGFTATKQVTAAQGKQPGMVYEQVPGAHAMVAATAKNVTLKVDPGVTMSNVIGSTLGQVINGLNANYTLTVNMNHDGLTNDQIYGQSIGQGQTTAKGAPLTVSVHAPLLPKCVPISKCYGFLEQKMTAQQYLIQQKTK